METVVKKADFVLTPYMKSNNVRAIFQLLNTLVPYFLLWVLAVKVASISLWFLPPILVLLTCFSCRCFSIMHDCGHYSLFSSKWVNRAVGFLLGVINAIPQYPWSRGHAYHHKTNGDWDRYRGPLAVLSTEQFAQLSPSAQKRYELLRHPLMLFPGGFFYLIIKPRLALILGICGLTRHFFNSLHQNPRLSLGEIFTSYQSRNWYTTGEFFDLLFNNIFVVSSWIVFSHVLGFGVFFGIYSITLTCSAAIFIVVFFVQHNFEGSYAHKTEGWNPLKGAIEGTSYLEMPTVVRWFAADIGYHNIHHLSERIPNYYLEACYHKNSHLLALSKQLKIANIPDCFKYILWDAPSDSLVSIATFRDQSALETLSMGSIENLAAQSS